MRAPPWLKAQPIAHRGLHDLVRGIVENMRRQQRQRSRADSPLNARSSLAPTAKLWCIMMTNGRLRDKTAAELKAVRFKDTDERMMTLAELCALVAGRVPLLIEVKSHFDGNRRLVRRMAQVLSSYDDPAVADVIRSGPGGGPCAS